MRRSLALVWFLAAVVCAGSAGAALQPVTRSFGELAVPRVRAGSVRIPDQHAAGRTRVIVTLRLPPLADATLPSDSRSAPSGRAAVRLDVADASSRVYLGRLDAAQRKAIAAIERTIPGARVSRRFRIVLDGFAVSLPVRRLPALLRLGVVDKVYPSLRYTRSLNRSTALIGAPALQAQTGARGDGVKVAIVDDGIDQTNPFFNPAGFQYPAGFPKGDRTFTSPKVIVARSFAGPGSGASGKEPLVPSTSFHGTHVGGVVAGVAGTTAPAGAPSTCKLAEGGCHPAVSGLAGVAPRAWLGNYRVFTVPNPWSPGSCCTANTPEIIAAFEAAVADGMDVINFSGGGPESDPASDALIAAVANVARAGVVPVMSAGNDRDLYGFGTVGSPSTAPDGISVAAVSNDHVFGRALTLVTPDDPGLKQISFAPTPGGLPQRWSTTSQPLVDVGTIVGTDGKPVDRQLCAASGNPDDPGPSRLPARSLVGALALVSRGSCSFDSKARRASDAGAQGIVLVDDRPGDPSGIALQIGLPGGMIADLDGARLRAALTKTGGRGAVLVGSDQLEIVTGRGGVPTSFSAGGPTAIRHDLKPDLSAPGAQVLSSTLAEFAGAQFAVLDGTSFSSPHIAGAAALLVQRHPGWTSKQVKSALMSTAGPAFADTSRTLEAPVVLEGAGLARLTEADDPRVFTDPQSLSFRDLNVTSGAASRSLLLTVSDAGGGSGAWQLELQPQSATAGATVDLSSPVTLGAGGSSTIQLTARASADAAAGDNYGFVVLRQGSVARRVPYWFTVTRPRLAGAQPVVLRPLQAGDTRNGTDRARVYRWPTSPFGVIGLFGIDRPVDEDGRETVYVVDLPRRAVNVGVAVVSPSPSVRASIQALLNANAPIHPWFLGSLDENDVEGYAGTPVNVNGGMPDFLFSVGAAGAVFAPAGRYYVAVDSGKDPFTGRSLPGPYVLRSWVNDVKPPTAVLITTRVATGLPTIVARFADRGAGVDPLSLTLDYRGLQVGASLYDPATGVAVFPLPRNATELKSGLVGMTLIASDYQETKNVNTEGNNLAPNTRFARVLLRAVSGPAITWVAPGKNACARSRAALSVVASDAAPISSVGFFDGRRQIARVRKNVSGIYSATWRTGSARRGRHLLRAIVSDTAGREATAERAIRVCAT